jgi:nitrate reductase gamma subunit
MPLIFFRLLPYLALVVFVIGLGMRVWRWLRAPVPFRTPLTPAAGTSIGGALLLAKRALVWPDLARSNTWLWLGAGAFHICLLLTVIRHLRYFLEPVPVWVMALQTPGLWAGYALLPCLLFLLLRRLWHPILRIACPVTDYLPLALLLGLAVSGMCLRLALRPDVAAVKMHMLALLRGDFSSLPDPSGLFWLHFGFLSALLIVFPFTKLVHGLGIWLNPVLNQVDNVRRKRHLNPWRESLKPGSAASLKHPGPNP